MEHLLTRDSSHSFSCVINHYTDQICRGGTWKWWLEGKVNRNSAFNGMHIAKYSSPKCKIYWHTISSNLHRTLQNPHGATYNIHHVIPTITSDWTLQSKHLCFNSKRQNSVHHNTLLSSRGILNPTTNNDNNKLLKTTIYKHFLPAQQNHKAFHD